MPTNRMLLRENRQLRKNLKRKQMLVSHAIVFLRITHSAFAKYPRFGKFVKLCDYELNVLKEVEPHGD